MISLTPAEARVLGALIEKSATTPDSYPLSLNALRLACNQTTNRDPIVDYDDTTVEVALEGLRGHQLARRLKNPGERVVKHRHVAPETLQLDAAETALIAVLLLRGAQTPGELKSRTERLHAFSDLDAVDAALTRLAERGLVLRLDRQPGQKETRWRDHLTDATERTNPDAPGEVDATRASAAPVVIEPAPTIQIARPDGSLRTLAVDTDHEIAAKLARARRVASDRQADVVALITDERHATPRDLIDELLRRHGALLWKPSASATGAALDLVDALHEAGVAVDVVQCVVGGAATGASVAGVGADLVVFRGAHDAGVAAARAAGDRGIAIDLELRAPTR